MNSYIFCGVLVVFTLLARHFRPKTIEDLFKERYCISCKYYGPDQGTCQTCSKLNKWEAKDD